MVVVRVRMFYGMSNADGTQIHLEEILYATQNFIISATQGLVYKVENI